MDLWNPPYRRAQKDWRTDQALIATPGSEPSGQTVIWDKEETGLCVLIPGSRAQAEGTVTFRVSITTRGSGKAAFLEAGRYPDGTYTPPGGPEIIIVRCRPPSEGSAPPPHPQQCQNSARPRRPR